MIDETPIRDLLKAIAPEAQSVDDDVLDLFIEIAARRNSPSVFGTLYRPAVAYHAAHLWALSTRDGGKSGFLAGRRAGEVSENYILPKASVHGWDDTSYGRLYKELRDSRPSVKPTSTSRHAEP
jgi:hypothetical protein